MAVTVSIAVLAGGTVGCAADDPGPARTGTNDDQLTAPQTPIPAAEAEPDPEASDDGPGDESERTDTGAPGEGEDDPGGGAAEEAVASTATRSQQLSTGPVLEWTEVDPDFDDLFQLESVGDGRVIARAWTDAEGQGLFGQRMVVSANGTDWTELALPKGLFPEQVNISSDRWVVTGRYPDVDRYDVGGDRVFFSDDQGSKWTEMVVDLPFDPASAYVVESWRAPPVMVSGERMVLVLWGYPTLDGQALLEDLGRLPAGKRVVFTLPSPDGISFTLVDSDDLSPYAFFGSLASQLAAVYGHFDEDESLASTYEELELTHDEAGLTDSEILDQFAPDSEPSIRILASDGAATEVVASYEGWVLLGAATSEGFIMTAFSDGADKVLRSPDGLAWSEDPLLGPGFLGGAISADGTIWGLAFENVGSVRHPAGRCRRDAGDSGHVRRLAVSRSACARSGRARPGCARRSKQVASGGPRSAGGGPGDPRRLRAALQRDRRQPHAVGPRR